MNLLITAIAITSLVLSIMLFIFKMQKNRITGRPVLDNTLIYFVLGLFSVYMIVDTINLYYRLTLIKNILQYFLI